MGRFREVLESGGFAVTVEIVPGRGTLEAAQERAVGNAAELWESGLVDAVSITDNPGGRPAILADALATELCAAGIESIAHFTCKDRNRSQVLSELFALERAGVENLLCMTGDYQAGGWRGRARPVFDIDSVHLQMLVRELNEGTADAAMQPEWSPTSRGAAARTETAAAGVEAAVGTTDGDEAADGTADGAAGEVRTVDPTHFFSGCVTNPFKYRAGEIFGQYVKLEKKILSGARFVISQVGYDTGKLHELVTLLRNRGIDVPVIANVYLLTPQAARAMRAGRVPGCHIPDALMERLERESGSVDGGRGAAIERAAMQVAIARGIGCSGAHIGGSMLSGDVVAELLERADDFAGRWEECVGELSFGEEDGFYLYGAAAGPDEQSGISGTSRGGSASEGGAADEGGAAGEDACGLNSEVRNPLDEDISGRQHEIFKGYRLSRVAHELLFTPGRALEPLLSKTMDRLDESRGTMRRHGLEHTLKTAIYGCRDCGDCALDATLYTCPMSECPKCQRNGPCGGSSDGWCEVFPGERLCIWYKAYHRAAAYGELWRLTGFITPPVLWEHLFTSSWSNYSHERDNIAGRIPADVSVD